MVGTLGGLMVGKSAQTDWSAMSLGEVIDILGTMHGGDVRGDIETVLKVIATVQGVISMLNNEFGTDTLFGTGADAGVEAGRRIAAKMSTGLDGPRATAAAMGQAADALDATRGHLAEFETFRGERDPERVAAIRKTVRAVMFGEYSDPMVAARSTLPVLSATPQIASLHTQTGADSTVGTGSGSVGDVGLSLTAGTTHVGDLGPSGPSGPGNGATPTPAATTPVNYDGKNAGPSTATADTPSTHGDRATDPGGLRRGGRTMPGIDIPVAMRRTGSGGSGTGGSGGGAGGGDADGPHGPPVPGLSAAPITPAESPAASPAASTAPRGGTPGPMSPSSGARRRGAQDTKHIAPHYLHRQEIVDDLPLVAPPVIGDWVPQSTPAVVPDSVPEPVVEVSGAVADADRAERSIGPTGPSE